MESIIISGGKRLSGTINSSGSKNASLPILALSILSKCFEIKNIPDLADVTSMLHLLHSLGVNYNLKEKNVLTLKTSDKISSLAEYDLVRKMRASFLVLGPLLSRNGYAKVSLPGGCAIGLRPVNLHIFAMKKLGSEIELTDGYVIAKAKKGQLIGNKIVFPEVSVGATENAIMAAVFAKGETLIKNAALEPEIEDLCNCLISMGVEIEGVGTSSIYIQGVNSLKTISYRVISDRIEACSFIIAAAITKSHLSIKNVNVNHITAFLSVMKKMGLIYKVTEKTVEVFETDDLNPIKLKTSVYPWLSNRLTSSNSNIGKFM